MKHIKRIVSANSNHCCIYDYSDQKGRLKLVREFDHPENRLRDSELLSDKAGNYLSRDSHGSYAPSMTAHEVNIDNFARDLARELDKEFNHHDFTELVLVMSPQMEGLINHHLNKQVRALVSHTIQKNLAHCTGKQLLTYLRTYFKEHKKPLH